MVIGITLAGDDVEHPRAGSGQIGAAARGGRDLVAAVGCPPLPAIFGKREICRPLRK
jgi:hypothetical protein